MLSAFLCFQLNSERATRTSPFEAFSAGISFAVFCLLPIRLKVVSSSWMFRTRKVIDIFPNSVKRCSIFKVVFFFILAVQRAFYSIAVVRNISKNLSSQSTSTRLKTVIKIFGKPVSFSVKSKRQNCRLDHKLKYYRIYKYTLFWNWTGFSLNSSFYLFLRLQKFLKQKI